MMKTKLWALVCVLGLGVAGGAEAKKLSEFPFYNYDLRFTNPNCPEYRYAEPVNSVSGKPLTAKPRGAYCKPADAAAAGARRDSVHAKLLETIASPDATEIFVATLSFSNRDVKQALCDAVEKRDVKVTLVLDRGLEEGGARLGLAEELGRCVPKSGLEERKPQILVRGNEGGLGFAHNKLVVVNPSSKGKIRIVFSSGNLSSGTTVHHENWNFITTDASTHFAQAHRCLIQGVTEFGLTKKGYKAHMEACVKAIKTPIEEDIQAFFIPGDGKIATQVLADWVAKSKELRIAAHRFSYTALMQMLDAALKRPTPASISIVTDDDLYWVGKYRRPVGPNTSLEWSRLQNLVSQGAESRFIQTNHGSKLLHHNKFIVFDERAVFAGAGNLTGDAFEDNFENFYFVQIPAVVSEFKRQHRHLFEDLGTAEADMPETDAKVL